MLLPESDASLAAVRDAGANWIAICVWWFQDNVNSTTIEPDYTRYSASPESVIAAIQKSHELGMNVMLFNKGKPIAQDLLLSFLRYMQ